MRKRKNVNLAGQVNFDVAIVGGGIAGVATAYEILKNTDKTVCIIESDTVAHGATGHNAGYVVAEFEKSFKEIVKEYGLRMAKEGLAEIEACFEYFLDMFEMLGLKKPKVLRSSVAFSDEEHFVKELEEEYLKYGKIVSEVFMHEKSKWLKSIPENFLTSIKIITDVEFLDMLNDRDRDALYFHAIIINKVALANSAIFTEKLAEYCMDKFPERIEIFEQSHIHSIRLLQNGVCILDSQLGLCISREVVLCTNGFEKFDIYGPYSMKVDKEFHHNVYGLIGYMSATFLPNDTIEEKVGVFYEENYKHKNIPIDAGPYIYFTNRKFEVDGETGNLWSIGGAEQKISSRIFYDKKHLADPGVYKELDDFQAKHFKIQGKAQFHWHGLMGYTRSGIRIVGRDKRFLSLYYNLGCNGIGIITSISGARRISKIINGEILLASIFDPM
jgi:glycine/D-amino acid oxidase-like deaminating enzyme